MKKYTDYTGNAESEDPRVLKYKDMASGSSDMIYESEGQAAVRAVPVPAPEANPEKENLPEYRPMPSAGIFEETGYSVRRRRAPKVLSAALYLAAALIASVALYKLVDMSGEINELAVKSYAVQKEIAELQKEETRLSYRLSSEMTELEMLNYAEEELNMQPATSDNTVNVNYGAGDHFVLGGQAGETATLPGYLGEVLFGTAEKIWNYIN